VQSTVQRLFWANLVTSLTPSTLGPEDLVLGARLLTRWGGSGGGGAYYEAEITAVRRGGGGGSGGGSDALLFDVRYLQDGVEERGLTLNSFRLRGDAVDARPLLALLKELGGRLIEAVPARLTAQRSQLMEALDVSWLAPQVARGALDCEAALRLTAVLFDVLSSLEAPARAPRTLAFAAAHASFVRAASAGNGGNGGGSGNGGGGAFIATLPSLFTFLHGALDQLKRDTVNAHLSLLAPQLAGDAGVAFERKRFDEKIAKGITSTQKTELWLTAAVYSFCCAAPPTPPAPTAPLASSTPGTSSAASSAASSAQGQTTANGFSSGSSTTAAATVATVATAAASDSYEQRRLALSLGWSSARNQVVAHALVELLGKDVRWDSPQAAALIPESLVWDAPRLAAVVWPTPP